MKFINIKNHKISFSQTHNLEVLGSSPSWSTLLLQRLTLQRRSLFFYCYHKKHSAFFIILRVSGFSRLATPYVRNKVLPTGENPLTPKRLGTKYSKKELAKFKSFYINFLANKQLSNYGVISCNERVIHTSGTDNNTEYTFIFTLPSTSLHRIILAVENLNTDRATMLFSFERHHY